MSSCSGNCGSCASSGGCENQMENRMKHVKQAVLVLSGKGGVGKSTVAASLAVMLAKQGKKVGLLDVDFHGPSQPTLFGLQHERLEEGPNGLVPAEVAGIRLMSVGLVLDNPDHAVIWRGPAKTGAGRLPQVCRLLPQARGAGDRHCREHVRLRLPGLFGASRAVRDRRRGAPGGKRGSASAGFDSA